MKIGPLVRPGHRIEKGKNRTVKKSHNVPNWGKAPTVRIETKISPAVRPLHRIEKKVRSVMSRPVMSQVKGL